MGQYPLMSSPRRNPGRRPQRSVQDEAADICSRLDALARRVLLSRPYARDLVRSVPSIDAQLPIAFDDGKCAVSDRASKLVRDLGEHVDDAILSCAAFRPGRVYSFFDESADAPECGPADPHLVFAGYSETGHPRWVTLLDLLLDSRDERAGDVAKDSGQPITVQMERADLVRDRLDAFSKGRRAYDITGQLVLGYFRQAVGVRQERFAVTLQIIRSASRSRVVRLGINVIGLLPDGRDAMEAETDREHWPFVDLLTEARRRLAAVNPKLKSLPRERRMSAAAEAASDLLHDMSHGFERGTRRENWRTEHAAQRAEEGTRPTGMARQDFTSARTDRIYLDAKESTYVVLGPKGRTHIFTPAGKHVTSLQMDGRSISERIRKNRWRPTKQEDARSFRSLVRAAFEVA